MYFNTLSGFRSNTYRNASLSPDSGFDLVPDGYTLIMIIVDHDRH
jgi:hypothetical protein